MTFLSTAIISMFITMALIPILRAGALRFNNGLDLPNPRKVHAAPIPKIGGLALAAGSLIPMLLWFNGDRLLKAILIGAFIIVICGALDDFKNLDYKAKFAGQIVAALVVMFYGNLHICRLGSCLPEGVLLPVYVEVPLTLLVIVGVTNAINLSDGLDGLAGGSSILIFLLIGYLAYTGLHIPVNHFILLFSMTVTGAIFGFLRFNTYPATVFMGDAGSQLLGFLAVTLALGLTQGNSPLSPLLPLILLGFPVLDTLTVMAERIFDGRCPFEADKNHFHHKLMRLSLFHTEAVMTIYILTACLAIATFLLRFQSEWLLLVFYLMFCTAVIAGFTVAEHRGWMFKRTGFFDMVIKGRLRVLKEQQVLIRVCFYCLYYLLPLMLIYTCLLPARLPRPVSWSALGLGAAIAVLWALKPPWRLGVLRVAFYLMVPLLAWLGQSEPAGWLTPLSLHLYDLLILALMLFMILTLKSTRRQKGFHVTPMDFLILVIALVAPNLPDSSISSLNMGMLAIRVMVLLFGFEVLIGELRGRLNRLTVVMLAALVVMAGRGLF